jgi:uncharacterized protein
MTGHDKAQDGLRLLKEAVIEFLMRHATGVTNRQVEEELGLESHRLGRQRGWLSWSILSLLMNEGKVTYKGKRYRAVERAPNNL